VVIDNSRFDLEKIRDESRGIDFRTRYLDVGLGSGTTKPPHMVFTLGGKEVAKAAVFFDLGDIFPSGASLGLGDIYDQSDGPSLKVIIVISVSGRTMFQTSLPAKATYDVPGSVITSMFREMI
jgi:hypothetical protein